MASLRNAEEPYSKGRLDALLDEWRENYPGLSVVIQLLFGGPARFPINHWSEEHILELFTDPSMPPCGWTADVAEQFQNKYSQESDVAIRECRERIVSMMYEVGLVGVRIGEGGTTQYSHTHQPVLPESVLNNEAVTVTVHPAFHKALLIVD